MAKLKDRFANIHSKIQQLIEQNQSLRQENTELSATIVRLNREISQKEHLIQSLTQQFETVEQRESAENSKQTKEQLKAYALEIEQCIGMIKELN